ncbi:hypothetical protein BH10PLA2_BH10PLA2_27120 [soil metagenome]
MSNPVSLSLPANKTATAHAVETRKGVLNRLRMKQIRLSSSLLADLSRVKTVSRLVQSMRNWPVSRQAFDVLAGYNRVFPDLDAARCVAEKYTECSHEGSRNAQSLSLSMESTRPSDYPVLHHLSGLVHPNLKVFDLGGTMGNLFYLYDRYLSFAAGVRWTVHDLPANMNRGREIARNRTEPRVQFADSPTEATGHDVLLISGSLHYFEFTLAGFLQGLEQRPCHVIVNRTPLVDAPTAAAVQSIGGVTVACKLLNRSELIAGMKEIGYELIDSWAVQEFSIRLPYDPDYWVKAYSGLYFRARV